MLARKRAGERRRQLPGFDRTHMDGTNFVYLLKNVTWLLIWP